MKYIFAGDRQIAVDVLELLITKGFYPDALMVNGRENSSHANTLIELSGLPGNRIFTGNEFKQQKVLDLFSGLKPTYIFGIHFPYIIPKQVIELPEKGFLNLHPGYLPYNKGWHTPSWAILEGTPAGATLHYMEEQLDAGDVIAQMEVSIMPDDTAHTLYVKLLKAELELFKRTLPSLISGGIDRFPQRGRGTYHKKSDLYKSDVQEIDLTKTYLARDLIKKIKALTTNKESEAAYFIANNKKYRIQVSVTEDDE